MNSGITWSPVFDDETSYSIGCVRIDPTHPEVVWVGTGEAVSGRHVAWGDGVYKSIDAGNSWTRMGLEHSEHVSDILIDPRHGDTVYVAAEGPLWSSGGERGLYKTTDSGETWVRVLYVDDDTGVTSAVFAPDDPDTIYAATYQPSCWGPPMLPPAPSTTSRSDSSAIPIAPIGRSDDAVDPSSRRPGREAAPRNHRSTHTDATRHDQTGTVGVRGVRGPARPDAGRDRCHHGATRHGRRTLDSSLDLHEQNRITCTTSQAPAGDL